MPFIVYLLPVLTVVSFFLFILFSERAWLPKFGTTEWIHRTANPPRLSPKISGALDGLDILAAVIAAVLYGGIIYVLNMPAALNILAFPSYSEIIYCICAALTVSTVLLLTKLLFGKTSIAIFAALIFAADTSFVYTVTTAGSETIGIVLIALYILLMSISVESPFFTLPAGLFLGIAAYISPKLAVFAALGLCICIADFAVTKRKLHLIPGLICNTALPAAVFYVLSLLMLGGISTFDALPSLSVSAVDYVYLGISVILFIMTAIHLFRDKSYAALIIATGLLLSLVLFFTGLNCLPVFTGAAAAYFTDIIFRRGGKLHKAFCIVFIVLAALPVLLYTVSSILTLVFPSLILF